MTEKLIKIRAPGKLMLVGEWAVLEPDKPCIVMSVDKYVECTIEEANSSSILCPRLDRLDFRYESGKVKFRRLITPGEKEKLIFAKTTIEIFMKFMEENANPINSFNITTTSHNTTIKVNETEKKIGFGSSAATCVAVGAAIMAFYEYDINDKKIKDIIFKLASIAHFITQGQKGSCFDIAASTYGGVLVYKAFSPLWLINELKAKTPLLEILEGDWTYLKIRPLKFPEKLKFQEEFQHSEKSKSQEETKSSEKLKFQEEPKSPEQLSEQKLSEQMNILCCWTSKSSNTPLLMVQVEHFKDNNYNDYTRIMDEIEATVDSLIDAIETGNINEIKIMLHQSQYWISKLNSVSTVGIITPELRKLIDIANDLKNIEGKHNCVGKLSGAGGGDSGIAVCFDADSCKKLIEEWKNAGLFPIDFKIDYEGMKRSN